MSHPTKVYLGDGVYVDVHALGIVLTTENGIETTNTIVLEPEVYTALENYVRREFLCEEPEEEGPMLNQAPMLPAEEKPTKEDQTNAEHKYDEGQQIPETG